MSEEVTEFLDKNLGKEICSSKKIQSLLEDLKKKREKLNFQVFIYINFLWRLHFFWHLKKTYSLSVSNRILIFIFSFFFVSECR